MQHKEELYAKQLYQQLQKKILKTHLLFFRILALIKKTDTTISIEGSGIQWKCLISKGTRQCTISCLNIDRTDLQYKGPEYFTHFKSQNKTQAEGRTFNQTNTIEAVKSWLKNTTVEELHAQFSFVDEEKRSLEKLRTEILESNPRTSELPQGEVITDHFSTSSLWFINGKRSCRIYFHGYDPNPRYIFYWHDDRMFEASSSRNKNLSGLLARWVIDKEAPSVLKEEFPEIEFGDLLEKYDQL